MVKSLKYWAAAAMVGALCWWGWRRHAAKTAATEATTRVEVATGDIEKHFVDSGEISPKNFVDVASQVGGRVVSIATSEGALVHVGDPLCVIQPGRSEADHYVAITVRTPITGIVMRYQKQDSRDVASIVRVGDAVTGLAESNSPTYLMTVADLSRLVVRMKISEMDILQLKAGMKVKVTVDALRDVNLPAKVSVISPQAEKDSNGIRSFRVEVELEKSDPRLKPGMSARVDGLLDARRSIRKIPLSAVFEEKGKEFAYTYTGEKNAPRQIPVRLGLRNETDVELLEGPEPGVKLLTERPVEKPN